MIQLLVLLPGARAATRATHHDGWDASVNGVLPPIVDRDTARRALPSLAVETERAALMQLYNTTRGDEWVRHDNWSTSVSVCDWYGTGCDTHGRVVSVDLNNNNLRGPLPPELANITQMQNL